MRILIPLDGSELSEGPLECGLEILGVKEHVLILLQCVDPKKWIMPERPTATWLEQREKEAVAESRAYLAKKAPARSRVIIRTPVGDPVTEILRESEDVDLILLSSQGRSGFKRFFLGSVAEEVLRRSTCPVLVVPPKERRQRHRRRGK